MVDRTNATDRSIAKYTARTIHRNRRMLAPSATVLSEGIRACNNRAMK
jgi:hypothetical protein